MIRESNAQKQRPVGLDDYIHGGIASDTANFMVIKGIRVSENPEHKSQKRRPVAIGLNGDFISQLPIISDFVESTKGWSIFAESRARHGSSEPFELGFISELIVEYPIMSDPAGSLSEFDPESDLDPVLRPIPYVISCGIHGNSRPTITRVVHNPLLLPHVGMVAKSPMGRALYGLFKPLLMIAGDAPRLWAGGMISSSLMQAPLGYLSSGIEAVQYSILHLKPLLQSTVLNSDSAYMLYEIMANRSQVPSCSVSTRTHGDVHKPNTINHRFVHSGKSETLPRVLIREKLNAGNAASSLALNYDSASLVESQNPSKIVYIAKFEPSMPREVGSCHFGMMRYSYRVFRALDLPNMAMIHWIMIHHGEVEHRLPAEKHACWKKRRKKSASLALNIYEWNLSDC